MTATDDTRARILARIHKLLALAQGQANAHEAEVAATMAAKLMARYNVDYADVIAAEIRAGVGDNIVERVVEPTNYRTAIPTYYNVLVTNVCSILSCRAVYTLRYAENPGDRPAPAMLVRGYKDDVAVATWLCVYVLRQVEALANASWKRDEYPALHDAGVTIHASRRRSYKDNYKYGLVVGLLPKIEEVYACATEEAEAGAEWSAGRGRDLAEIKSSALDRIYGPEPKRTRAHGGQNDVAIERGYEDRGKVQIRRVVQSDIVKMLTAS